MQNESPYSTPNAHLNENIAQPDSALVIRKVSAGRGAFWILDGFKRLLANPFSWAGIGVVNLLALIVIMIISVILSFVVIGSFVPYVVYPVVVAGFMKACANQDENSLQVRDFFAGFSLQTGQLFLMGALYTAMMIGVFIVAMIVMLGLGFSAYTLADGNSFNNPAQMLLMVSLVILIFLGLTIPIIMAIWFSPALIVLNRLDAITAIKYSFKACLKNFVPYLIYGIVGLIVSLLIVSVFALIFFATGLIGSGKSEAGLFISIGIFYTLMAIFGAPYIFITIYSSYLDIFQKDPSGSEASN